jgi:hypothetical protein
VLIAGLLSPATAWLAEAAVTMLRSAAPPGAKVWTGWAQQLPGGVWPVSDCVVCCNEGASRLAATASHVLFSPRDLRDAVVAYQRGLGGAANLTTAQQLVQYAARWEGNATLTLSFEAILADPPEAVQRLARHLGVDAPEPLALARGLQRILIATNAAASPKTTPPRAFVTALPAATLAMIEARFGVWLLDHGYRCVTRSAHWARVTDVTRGREELWTEFQTMAGACAGWQEGGPASNETLSDRVQQLRDFCGRFGAPQFQLSALELLAVLCERNGAVECTRAELRREFRKTDGEANRVAPAILSGKTAAEPLPLVSPTAVNDHDTVRRLAAHARGRTVGFLLHGSSVAELANHVASLPRQDVVWVGLNHFTLLEDRCLRPGGCEFSVVICCADNAVKRRLADLQAFLGRPRPRLLITRPDQLAEFAQLLAPHRASIALQSLPPLWPYPNSLTMFLRLLVQARPRRIVLFGCDGYLGDDDVSLKSYLGAEQFVRDKHPDGVLLDTLMMNAHLPRILNRWRARLGDAFPEIVNCSPGTVIRAFPTIDYLQAAAALAGAPVATGAVVAPPDVPVPAPPGPTDPAPELAACFNAGRRGDLARAREHALRAMRIDPLRMTPFAQRMLQSDPRAIAAGFHLLTLTGAELPGSAEQIRRDDLAREMRETSESVGAVRQSWDTWE